MVNFILGVFIGIIFDIAFNEVYKEKQWSKWTLDDFEENFDKYMEEWSFDEEEKEGYKNMIATGEPVADWGIVEDGERTYYIQYCL